MYGMADVGNAVSSALVSESKISEKNERISFYFKKYQD
jgi:hypothetical protein